MTIMIYIALWAMCGGIPAYIFAKFGEDYYDVTVVQFIAVCLLGPIAALWLIGDYLVTHNKFDFLNQSIIKGKRK